MGRTTSNVVKTWYMQHFGFKVRADTVGELLFYVSVEQHHSKVHCQHRVLKETSYVAISFFLCDKVSVSSHRHKMTIQWKEKLKETLKGVKPQVANNILYNPFSWKSSGMNDEL